MTARHSLTALCWITFCFFLVIPQKSNAVSLQVENATGNSFPLLLFLPSILSGRNHLSLYTNPTDPQILKLKTKKGATAEYFAEKDETGKPTYLTHIYVKKPDGTETKVIMDSQGRPARFLNEDSSEVRIAWLSDTSIEVTILIPGEETPPPRVIDLQNPIESLSAESERFLNSTQAAISSELPVNAVESSTIPGSYSVDTVVKQCGTPRNDAFVEMRVKYGEETYTLPSKLKETDPGHYVTSLPTARTGVGKTAEEVCNDTEEIVGMTCEFSTQLAVSAPAWCAPAVTGTPAAYAACLKAVEAHALYCHTLGVSPSPGADSIAKVLICDEINNVVERAIDVFAEKIYLAPMITVEGIQYPMAYQEASTLGAYPSFEKQIDIDYGTVSTEVSPKSGTAPLTVQLSADPSVTWTFPNTNFTYTWYSSDGQEVTGQEASIQFTKPGKYGIRMTLVDEYGCSGLSEPAHILVDGTTCTGGDQTVFYGGHEWQRCDDGNMYSWEEAAMYCQNLVLGGYSDWRLPTKEELKSLVFCSNGHSVPLMDWDKTKGNTLEATCCNDLSNCSDYYMPTISSIFEVHAPLYSSSYWTSTTYGTSSVWVVIFGSMGGGGMATWFPDDYAYGCWVRCVR